MGLVEKNRVNGKRMTRRRIDEEAVEIPIGRAEFLDVIAGVILGQ
jgi:hypothetical protein